MRTKVRFCCTLAGVSTLSSANCKCCQSTRRTYRYRISVGVSLDDVQFGMHDTVSCRRSSGKHYIHGYCILHSPCLVCIYLFPTERAVLCIYTVYYADTVYDQVVNHTTLSTVYMVPYERVGYLSHGRRVGYLSVTVIRWRSFIHSHRF
jgi:hypothetical protein